jgi:hypothetical protein
MAGDLVQGNLDAALIVLEENGGTVGGKPNSESWLRKNRAS